MQAQGTNGMVICQKPVIDHLDKHGYLFGHPIAHSLSPLFHQTIFDALGLNWDYLLLPSTDVKQFLNLVRDRRCYGSAVTMPNKVAILPHLDAMTPECYAVGACNTVFWRDSKLVGANTDTIGIRESFYQNAPDDVFQDKPGLVIGGGGAARSAVYALVEYMKCKTVYLVNRDPSEIEATVARCKAQGYGDGLVHVSSVSQAESLEAPGAIVACVPNCAPVTESEWEVRRIAECFFKKSRKGAMLEMCYHPVIWTALADIADKAGWIVIMGTEAMIYQGFEQARYWTGKDMADLPVQRVKDVILEELIRARSQTGPPKNTRRRHSGF
ncbi:hypothetical protein LTR37_001232 [Vermiconidia calcicola]|uniref:Uncharacterized protein n=1 Tax=Vermiconidia calcicola TaxID=1690605 RepID=A0ACC3NXF1_9PEZI|nr:hypothetical protein LTR37_001232 [Vermiconidia calcicola]